MMRFSALNKKESDSPSLSLSAEKSIHPTKEAQESAVLQLYHEAMKQQKEGHLDEAKQLYIEILQSEIITNCGCPQDDGGINTLHRVKFLILKNLASIAKEKDELSTAVAAYIEASQIDSTDITLWYQLALVSSSLGDLFLMRKALEQCLNCNKTYWPAINLLCSVLLALKDYYACLQVSLVALQIDPHFSTGLALLHYIVKLHPEYMTYEPLIRLHLDGSPTLPDISQMLSEVKTLQTKYSLLKSVTLLPESISPPIKLSYLSFDSLGKFLIATYNHCLNISKKTHQPSLTCSVSLYYVLEGATEGLPIVPPSPVIKSSKEPVVTDRKRRLQFDNEPSSAPKRRSTRVKAKEKEHQDYFLLIKKYLPPEFKILVLPDLCDISPIIIKVENTVTKTKSEISNDNDNIDMLDEVETVRDFIQSHQENRGIVDLFFDFLWSLANQYYKRWSKYNPYLSQIYIECYQLVHDHFNYLSPFSELSEGEQFYSDRLYQIALCYLELKLDSLEDSSLSSQKKSCGSVSLTSLPSCFSQCLVFVQCYQQQLNNTTNNRTITLLRVEWIKGKWALLQKQKQLALKSYYKCKTLLAALNSLVPMETKDSDNQSHDLSSSEPPKLCLPNCTHDKYISEELITARIQLWEQLISLEKVHQFYTDGKYSDVIDILLPVLGQESYSEFFLGFETKSSDLNSSQQSGLHILLESLLKMDQLRDTLQYSVQFLLELLLHYQTYSSSDEWAKELNYIYKTIDKCLELNRQLLLSQCPLKVMKVLTICIIKTLEIIQDLSDSFSTAYISVILPWKLLHIIISHDQWSEDAEEEQTKSLTVSIDHSGSPAVSLTQLPLTTDCGIQSTGIEPTTKEQLESDTSTTITRVPLESNITTDVIGVPMESDVATTITEVPLESDTSTTITREPTESNITTDVIGVPMESDVATTITEVPLESDTSTTITREPTESNITTDVIGVPMESDVATTITEVPLESDTSTTITRVPMESDITTIDTGVPVESDITANVTVESMDEAISIIEGEMNSHITTEVYEVPLESDITDIREPLDMATGITGVSMQLDVTTTVPGVPNEVLLDSVLSTTATEVPLESDTITFIPEVLTESDITTTFNEVLLDSDITTSAPEVPLESDITTAITRVLLESDITNTVSGVPLESATTVPGAPLESATTVPGVPLESATTVPGVPLESTTTVPGVPLESTTTITRVPLESAATATGVLSESDITTSVPGTPLESANTVPRAPLELATAVTGVPMKSDITTTIPGVPLESATIVTEVPLESNTTVTRPLESDTTVTEVLLESDVTTTVPEVPMESATTVPEVPMESDIITAVTEEPMGLSKESPLPLLPPSTGTTSPSSTPILPSSSETSLSVTVAINSDVTVSPSISHENIASRGISPLEECGMNRQEIGLKFLKMAHAQLGSFSWCSHEDGVFLLYIVSILRQELRSLTNLPPNLREMLLIELEQCYYCLYGYPYKKAKQRGLIEHNCDQISLTWKSALMLLEYFHPTYLPSIDDIKSPQVTAELITLYKQIIEVIPKEGQVISVDKLVDYIEGTTCVFPSSLPPQEHSTLISEIYYLLADECLKTNDNNNAIKYYQLNLSYCPDKFDSWAGLALARSRRITLKLNTRDSPASTVEKLLQKNVLPTVICFKKALELNSKHCYVVEKFGLFCYAVQSFTSQIIKLPQLYRTKGIQPWSKKTIQEMIQLAKDQFQHALTLEGTSHAEPWIYHFILGKILWKLKKPIELVLNHLGKSAEILHQDGAAYPATLEVASKGHAIEALEVHYQFMSVSLKCLTSLSVEQPDPSTFSSISQALSSIMQLPLSRLHCTELWKWAENIVTFYRHGKNSDGIMEATNPTSCLVPQASIAIKQDNTVASNASTHSQSSFGLATISTVSTTQTINTVPTIPSPTSSVSLTQNIATVLPNFGYNTVRQSSIVNSQSTEMSNVPIIHTSSLEPALVNQSNAAITEQTAISSLIVPSTVDTTTSRVSLENPMQTTLSEEIIPHPLPQHTSPNLQDTDMEEKESDLDVVTVSTIPETTSPTEELQSSSRWNCQDPLIECLYGVALCAVKFPAYYKPLYRLASVLNKMSLPEEAKKFLIGPLPECFSSQHEKLLPIFALKTNIFQNMWQIQIVEINRPGNFSTHARTCLHLLLTVLTQLNELASLLYIAQQLKNKPDATKQYVREAERSVMYIQALHCCVTVLKSITKQLSGRDDCHKLLLDANTVKSLLSRAEGRKDESVKNVEECMMKLFAVLWSDLEVRALFLEDGFYLPHEPTMDLCLKYCHMKTK